MRKLNLKSILFHSIGIFFFVHAIQKFYYSYQGKQIQYIYSSDFHANNSFEKSNLLSEFLLYQAVWTFIPIVIGIIIIGRLNWLKKISYWNTIIVSIIMFVLYFSGIFFRGTIKSYFNSFGWIFIKDYKYSYFIAGTIFCLIGSAFILGNNVFHKKHSL